MDDDDEAPAAAPVSPSMAELISEFPLPLPPRKDTARPALVPPIVEQEPGEDWGAERRAAIARAYAAEESGGGEEE